MIVTAFLFDLDEVRSWDDLRTKLLARLVAEARAGTSVAAYEREGGVLLHSLAYVNSELSISDDGTRVSRTQRGRQDVWTYLLAEFNAALGSGRNTADPEQVERCLTTSGVEVISIGYLTRELAETLDRELHGKPGYLGATDVDRAHPIMFKLLWSGLIRVVEITGTRVTLLDEPPEERYELVDRPDYWWSHIGADSLGWTNSYDTGLVHPPVVEPLPPSARGAEAVAGYERLMAPTPAERAVSELALRSPRPTGGHELDAQRLPGRAEAIVPEAKLRRYALDPDHPEGKHKARLFRELLDIGQDDWRFLREQLLRGVREAPLYRTRFEPHGVKFEVISAVRGRNEKVLPVLSAWIIRTGEAPTLVTAYLAPRDTVPETDAFDVPLQRPGEEIAFADLWALATAAANDAVNALVPIPMKVVGGGIAEWIAQGEEGVASIRVYDARTGLGRWLRAQNLGRAGHLSGSWVCAPPRGYQQAKVWAETCAEVLQWHDIGCEVHATMT